MGRVAAHMTLSLDGFGAGPNQSQKEPLGENGETLHRWMFEDADNNMEERNAITTFSAFIMGRHMFGPVDRALEPEWRGWWGENPPYHGPVYILTRRAREPLVMEGGTTFHFVTDGPEAALEMARHAAGEGDISIAGGVATTRHYLNTGAIDDLYIQMAPIILGAGERLWDGLTAELEPISARQTRLATHVHFKVRK